MQSSCEVPVTAAVRSLDSKVVVITPKQLAQLGIDKDIKSVCQRVRNGDGAFATGQSSGGLLNTLRAKINLLLTEQRSVVDGLQISDVCKNQNARKKEIVILSNQVVHYSESEMKAMLNPEKPHVLNGTLGAKNVTGPEATNSKNPNFVPDRTPEKPTAAEGVSNCDTKPPSTSTKQSTVPWNQLIPSTFAKRFNVVKTYSKVNTISIVQKEETTTQTPKKPTAKIIKTIKMEDNAKTKPKEKVVEEAKTKDQEEAPVTPVAPKKRGRPRKTPLQPKVDEDSDPEPKEKPKKEVKEPPKPDQNNPAPRRRGRPRKVPVEPKPEEASSDEDSPVEKKRKTKKVEPKELSTPSAGTRTSGRKRKVVDYAALSGGRISSSEEEDFAEILAQEERSKKKTAKEEKEDSAEEEPEQEKKEVKSPKLEAVHPLKKRIKMEHAQAIEKEKLEDGKKEKDKNGEDEKMDTTEAVEEESSKTENSEEAKKPASENKVNDEDKRKTNENVKSNEKNDIVEANKEEVKTNTSLEEGKTTKPSLEEEKTIKPSQEEKSTKPSSEEEKSTKSSSEKETTTTKPSSGETTKPSSGETTTKLSSGETTKPSSGETTTKLSSGETTKPSGETTKPSSEEETTTADGNQSTKPSSEGNEEEGSKRVKEESSEIKCGVCEETMDGEASWVKHKLARHNDLAWKVGDKPLELRPQREPQSQM